MSPSRIAATGVALLAGLSTTVASAAAGGSSDSCPSNKLNASYPLPVAASGWSYRLIANSFTKPRSIAFDSDGGLLVVDSGVGLARLSFNDEGGTCLTVASKTVLVRNQELNHGLAIAQDGSTVYASTADKVFSWTYDSKSVSLGASNRTLVANMSNSDLTTRTLLLSNKHPDMLLVSRGSQSDTDDDARQLSSGHAQIRAFNITALGARSEPYDFTDGIVMGWGLRNSVGVAEHPVTGSIWSVENSVDAVERDGKDVHQNNPGEELNFHGFLNGSTEHQGGNYGYPLCYTLWNTTDFPNLGSLQVGDQFPSAEGARTLSDQDCNSKYVDSRLAFESHAAPLDIKFSNDGSLAYVAFHGSFDTSNPVGYRIASIDFSNSTGQPTAKQSSQDAAVDVLTNPDVSGCPDSCFHPVGMAWDTQGRLWFSSDSTGEIYVLQHDSTKGKAGDNDSGQAGKGAGPLLVPNVKAALTVTLAAVVAGCFLA